MHDEPDLSGIDDGELRALTAGCLAKDPADRPTARELDERIVEDAPHGSVDWLPEDVVQLIADRSAEMLALPGIEPTVIEEPPSRAPGRRRLLALAAGGAVVAAGGGGFAAWEALRDDGRGAGKSGGRDWIIGVQADLSGARKAAGRAQERGVRVAAERFNSRADRLFTLQVKALDDRGDTGRAVKAAEEFARDRDVLAVVGPTGDAETGAVLGVYDEAMLPLITVSSLALVYAPRSRKSFFQAAPSYAVLTEPAVNRLVLRPDVERLGILLDRSGGLAAYTGGYAANLLTGVLTTGTTYPRVVPAGTRDMAPVLADMLAHGSDALFYAGDGAGAARTARALAATPFKGPRMAMHTAMVPGFIEETGDAATGWEFTAPYTEATAARREGVRRRAPQALQGRARALGGRGPRRGGARHRGAHRLREAALACRARGTDRQVRAPGGLPDVRLRRDADPGRQGRLSLPGRERPLPLRRPGAEVRGLTCGRSPPRTHGPSASTARWSGSARAAWAWSTWRVHPAAVWPP
ncbi:Receptor family ligand binding region [Streptomyces sp. ADI93-02]|nr:Receptor family ligand binding region [Streptomyces sp. ADI93-02]